ncbi:MAG TPA: succinate--CoA ligase subunit beta [Leptolyngbyaceae cyanobacterium]
MDLLEYQAKELFREIGIPVLPSQRIDCPRDLKGLKIPYPVVLKSQVPIGGRGKAGGIKFVENTIDAIAAAQTIFHLPIMGKYPEVLLAEARYNAEREFYLAVALDYTLRRPVLLGSPQGGVDVEAVMQQMQQVVVEERFSPFYARKLALKMGLQGSLIESVSNIVVAMYKLFVEKDLDLVEINPLGVSPSGELMALDGKITANDSALERHPDLTALLPKLETNLPLNYHRNNGNKRTSNKENNWQSEGNIAIICNGMGLGMATLDLIQQVGGKPAKLMNLGEDITGKKAENLCDRLQEELQNITQENGIKVVVINILSGVPSCDKIASAIANFLSPNSVEVSNSSAINELFHKETTKELSNYPKLVVRLAGTGQEEAKERLKGLGVFVVDTFDEVVLQAVAFTKGTGKRS